MKIDYRLSYQPLVDFQEDKFVIIRGFREFIAKFHMCSFEHGIENSSVILFEGGCIMAINFEILGKRIKELRGQRMLSQEELAELADVTAQYISYIETGRKKVSLQVLVNIADGLSVSVDNLLMGNQKMEIPLYMMELTSLMENCNQYERRIVYEQIISLVKTLKENRKLL